MKYFCLRFVFTYKFCIKNSVQNKDRSPVTDLVLKIRADHSYSESYDTT